MRMIMIKNYVLVAWRSFLRQREYSVLNVVGLTIGFTSCMIIMLYVINERSFDRFHSKADRIFRVVQNLPANQGWAWTGGVMPSLVESEFKEVKKVVSIHCATSWNAKRANAQSYTYVSYEKGNQEAVAFEETRIFYTDPEFFDVFDFEFVKGSPGTALKESGQVLITESTAKRYFGSDDPIGKTLKLDNFLPVTVTGVLKDVPYNSHFRFDFLCSFATFKALQKMPTTAEFTSHWWPVVWTYVLLDEPGSAEKINAAFPEVIRKHRSAEEAKLFVPHLQPLTSIHLFSDLQNEINPNGSITNVYIFTTVAVFSLVLACINFMNLATARAVKRAKEIGVRKSIGGQRKQIAVQFFYESALLNVMAFAFAIVLTEILLPLVNLLLHQQLALGDGLLWWGMAAGIVVVSTLLSGSYPALYLSSMKPSEVLKGVQLQGGGAGLRRGLVVFQFVLSVTLLFCTAVAWFQVNFLKGSNLGFEQHRVVAVRTGPSVTDRYGVLRDKLLQDKNIESVTGVSDLPGIDPGWGPQVEFEGYNPQEFPFIFQQFVDYDFFSTLNISLLEGRTFSREFSDEGKSSLLRNQFPAHEGRNFVINESAARFFGKTPAAAIGMPLRLFTEENGELFSETKGMVVGVVKDFHTADLHSPIRPTVFTLLNPNENAELSYALIKIAPGNFSNTLDAIKKSWRDVNGNAAFEFSFLDEDINKQYWQDQQLGDVVGVFAGITLLISCLGLFGLSAYTTEVRTKEIGVRKVLGASEQSIVRLLSREYLALVTWAIVIALPLGWWIMTQWLAKFPYHTSMKIGLFISVSALAVGIALVTVSFQSIKAATLNPVKALRNE